MKKLILFTTLSLSSISFALPGIGLEIRGNAGVAVTKAKDFNDQMDDIDSGLVMGSTASYGFDVIAKLPILPGFGIRYENQGAQKTVSYNVLGIPFSTTFDLAVKRTALLLNYRIIDTVFFVGPIATVGLFHSGEFEVTTKVLTIENKVKKNLATKATSITAGVEGGLKLLSYLVGGELGYQVYKIDKKDVFAKDLDLSGVYLKILVGFAF